MKVLPIGNIMKDRCFNRARYNRNSHTTTDAARCLRFKCRLAGSKSPCSWGLSDVRVRRRLRWMEPRTQFQGYGLGRRLRARSRTETGLGAFLTDGIHRGRPEIVRLVSISFALFRLISTCFEVPRNCQPEHYYRKCNDLPYIHEI